MEERPGPRARQGRAARSRARRGPERGRHAPAEGRLSGAARAPRPTSRAWSSPGEVEALGPGAQRFERGRPRDGDRRRRRPGGAGAGARARGDAGARAGSTGPPAGGLPEVFTTAHDALFTQARLRPGEHLLVHGAAGGVGCAAVQLGRGDRRARDRHRPQRGAPRPRRGARRPRDRPRGLRGRGPLRRDPRARRSLEPPGQREVARHRRPDRRDRRRRHRPDGRDQPPHPHAEARAGSTARRSARGRSRRRRSPCGWSRRRCSRTSRMGR